MNFKSNLDNNTPVSEDTSSSYKTELVGYGLDSLETLLSGEPQLHSIQPENIEPLSGSNQVVFIDSNVKDSQVLIDNLSTDISVTMIYQ